MRHTLAIFCVAVVLLGGAAHAQTVTASNTPSPKPPEKTSNISKFIARRGTLLVKKFGTVAQMTGVYEDKLEIGTLILSTPNSTTPTTVYGVRFERPASERYELEELEFLDFDEAKAVVEAIDYMKKVSQKMMTERHENTEIVFESRGGIMLGFYQTDGEQKAFVTVERKPVFFPITRLWEVGDNVKEAVKRLRVAGAK